MHHPDLHVLVRGRDVQDKRSPRVPWTGTSTAGVQSSTYDLRPEQVGQVPLGLIPVGCVSLVAEALCKDLQSGAQQFLPPPLSQPGLLAVAGQAGAPLGEGVHIKASGPQREADRDDLAVEAHLTFQLHDGHVKVGEAGVQRVGNEAGHLHLLHPIAIVAGQVQVGITETHLLY